MSNKQLKVVEWKIDFEPTGEVLKYNAIQTKIKTWGELYENIGNRMDRPTETFKIYVKRPMEPIEPDDYGKLIVDDYEKLGLYAIETFRWPYQRARLNMIAKNYFSINNVKKSNDEWLICPYSKIQKLGSGYLALMRINDKIMIFFPFTVMRYLLSDYESIYDYDLYDTSSAQWLTEIDENEKWILNSSSSKWLKPHEANDHFSSEPKSIYLDKTTNTLYITNVMFSTSDFSEFTLCLHAFSYNIDENKIKKALCTKECNLNFFDLDRQDLMGLLDVNCTKLHVCQTDSKNIHFIGQFGEEEEEGDYQYNVAYRGMNMLHYHWKIEEKNMKTRLIDAIKGQFDGCCVINLPKKQLLLIIGGVKYEKDETVKPMGIWKFNLVGSHQKWIKLNIYFPYKKVQAITTSNEKYIIGAGGFPIESDDGTDNIWIIEIIEEDKYKFRTSKIKCPQPGPCTVIRMGCSITNELLTHGWIKEFYEKQKKIMKKIQFPPTYLISLIAFFYKQETMHWFGRRDNFANNDNFGRHQVIKISSILSQCESQ